jgi:2-aminoadipate transaminase
VLILEDVAYREMSFDGGALPSLWSLGPDVVVQAGTFSKIFCPGVRLGWAVGPADVVAQMAAAKQTGDQCASALAQRIVEQYGRAGHFERQVPQSRALYERGWRAVEGALHQHMPPGMSWSEPSGGFFTWLTLPEGIDASELRAAALEAGVNYVPGRPFYPGDEGAAELRVSFSYLSEAELATAVERLAGVIAA